MKVIVAFALGLFSALKVFAAQPCLDNFTTTGNPITGRTFKTFALVDKVNTDDAFARVYAFTAENGFTVLSSSKEAGVISAVQASSYASGKRVPLSITFKRIDDGTLLSMSYANPAGMFSSGDDVRKHFCETIASAMIGAASIGAAADNAPPSQSRQRVVNPIRGAATITSEQRSSIKQEVLKSAKPDILYRLAADAAPQISAFLELSACLQSVSGTSPLNVYAAPGQTYSYAPAVMAMMRYHDKDTCLSVERVHGWKMPANNALQFEVVYKADDSGQVAKVNYEVVKQPDGEWLFTR